MSGVNDDGYVHYYIQTTEHLNRLGAILVYSCSGVGPKVKL